MTQLSYRVWCLSWEDDDNDGHDVVAYDLLTQGYKPSDRRTVYVPTGLLDASDAAEAYADYAHAARDGNECTWPLTFRVRCPDGSLQDFEVDREYWPEFSASPVKKERVA